VEAPPGSDQVDNLVWALRHPDGDRAVMAAVALGRRDDARAVRALRGVVEDPPDPYVASEALRSLVKIEGVEPLRAWLEELVQGRSIFLASVATEALERPYDDRQRSSMHLEGTGKQLSIYCGESDRYHHHALAAAIVERARQEGLAGATVLRGIEGFGASSHLHTSRLLSLSDDLPILIQIVDREDRIDAFLPMLDEMLGDGLVTTENVHVVLYRGAAQPALDDEEPAS
jgi:PII-like signaling protein